MNKPEFKKIIAFTDIHFGRSSNDRQANMDSSDFVDFVITTGKQKDCNIVIFLGDWHDNRHSLHVSTLNFSDDNIKKLSDNFEHVYFIPGNHDLHYREKRDLNSIPFAKHFHNVTIIDDFLTVDNVTFCPWILNHEWSTLVNIESKYVFGHFEFPSFLMNGKTKMPDHGQIKLSDWDKPKYIFSGHFHKRQTRNNIWYMGNVFPMNFGDAWDDDRGCMILDMGNDGAPEFIKWDKAPSYKTMMLSELLESPDAFMREKTYIRASIDLALTYEENQFLKDLFFKHYNIRKLELTPVGKEISDITYVGTTIGKSVDQSVIDGISNIEVTSMDKTALVKIYQHLLT
jgi:DNA repair exonuclease SbcCD nuclease subunit